MKLKEVKKEIAIILYHLQFDTDIDYKNKSIKWTTDKKHIENLAKKKSRQNGKQPYIVKFNTLMYIQNGNVLYKMNDTTYLTKQEIDPEYLVLSVKVKVERNPPSEQQLIDLMQKYKTL